MGRSIMPEAQSNSRLPPPSVTSRLMCSPPHTPVANLSLLSEDTLLMSSTLLPQELPCPSIVKRRDAVMKKVIRSILLIRFLSSEMEPKLLGCEEDQPKVRSCFMAPLQT